MPHKNGGISAALETILTTHPRAEHAPHSKSRENPHLRRSERYGKAKILPLFEPPLGHAYSVSGLGSITSRTIPFISATDAIKPRSVRRVEPKVSNSSGVRPSSM